MGCGVSKSFIAQPFKKRRLRNNNKCINSNMSCSVNNDNQPSFFPSQPAESSDLQITANVDNQPKSTSVHEHENKPPVVPGTALTTLLPPLPQPHIKRNSPLVELPLSSFRVSVDDLEEYSSTNNSSRSNHPESNNIINGVDQKRKLTPTSPVHVTRTRSYSPKPAWHGNGGGLKKSSYKAIDLTSKRLAIDPALPSPKAATASLSEPAPTSRDGIIKSAAAAPAPEKIMAAVQLLSREVKRETACTVTENANVRKSLDSLMDRQVKKPGHKQPRDGWINLSSPPAASYMKDFVERFDESTQYPHLCTTPRRWTDLLNHSNLDSLDLEIEDISLDDDNDEGSGEKGKLEKKAITKVIQQISSP